MSRLRVSPVDFSVGAERDAILELLDMYAREEMGGGEPLSEAVRARLVAGLEAEPGATVLLAWSGDTPVGIAVCFRRYSSFAAAPLLNVHDLAVRPELRGQGVGRSLLEAAETRARAIGCCRLTLEVREDNLRARGLYESYGFGDFELGEGRHSTLFLSKTLGVPAP